MIEREGSMSTTSVTVKSVEALRIASISGVAESTDSADVAPVIQPLFGQLFAALGPAGVEPAGPIVATYAPTADGKLSVSAACTVADGVTVDGLVISTLPAQEQVASYVHHGEMANIGEGYQILATWIDDNGYVTDGTAREVYLLSHPEPEEKWQTELQMPITASA
jgi:effector-binding domain-containing protein